MTEELKLPEAPKTEEELIALAEKQYNEYLAKMNQHLSQLDFGADMMKSLESLEMMAALEPMDDDDE